MSRTPQTPLAERRPAIREGDSILAIAVARIGDTLLATPALRALRGACGPRGRLTVLAHPRRAELLAGLPFVDRIASVTKHSAFWRARLRPPAYDVAAVWGHDEALVAFALRAARRVAALRQRRDDLNRRLYALVEAPDGEIHAVEDRLRLARALGADTADLRLAYVVSAAEAAAARERIGRFFGAGQGPLVGIQLHSFPTKPYRDWPVPHFAALISRLLAHCPQARVLIFGDAHSAGAAKDLSRGFAGSVASFAGELSLRETAASIGQLDLYVGVDTGPTHLAGALAVPMVALYHCRHRGAWLAPLQHSALTTIEHPAKDAECTDMSTMADIDVDRVWAAVVERLTARAGKLPA